MMVPLALEVFNDLMNALTVKGKYKNDKYSK